jgi:hypothetical protein
MAQEKCDIHFRIGADNLNEPNTKQVRKHETSERLERTGKFGNVQTLPSRVYEPRMEP